MKKIRISYVDFWKSFDGENYFLTDILRKHYDVEVVKEAPDLVFCSCFGKEYHNYSCPRIFYTGEALSPDFNIYDYAIGFDPIEYGDRYYQYPLYLENRDTLEEVLHKHERSDEELLRRKKFCAMIVSSGSGYSNVRDKIFNAVSEYKQVDSAGRYRNNLPDGKPVKDKNEFLQDYRFSMALENSIFPGYVTEKIMDAWAAGTIPIYYGDKSCVEMFDPGSFIWLPPEGSFSELVERIKHIDENEEEYLRMQHTPAISADTKWDPAEKEKGLESFLVNACECTLNKEFRRGSKCSERSMHYEISFAKWDRLENSDVYRFLQRQKRKFFGVKKRK